MIRQVGVMGDSSIGIYRTRIIPVLLQKLDPGAPGTVRLRRKVGPRGTGDLPTAGDLRPPNIRD
jgi:hypothetical protein